MLLLNDNTFLSVLLFEQASIIVRVLVSECEVLFCVQIEEMGGSALVFGGDMSKEADVDALFKAVSIVPFFFPCFVIQ